MSFMSNLDKTNRSFQTEDSYNIKNPFTKSFYHLKIIVKNFLMTSGRFEEYESASSFYNKNYF